MKNQKYPLVSKENSNQCTEIKVNGKTIIGDNEFAVMAGPCAVESKEQMLQAAIGIKKVGATILRGGAYKPRSSPYSFQGLEKEGYQILKEVSDKTGLVTVSEVMDEESISLAKKYIDILQIGSRNMQNFHLLKLAGKAGKPVLLKRGLSATIEEWLMAAEYILAEGNNQVILCERGIRTFETATRNTLDISAVPLLKRLTHLPVIVDPSHAAGDRELVLPLSKAASVVGANGLMIEVHPSPKDAKCDGAQSLSLENFNQLMLSLKDINSILRRAV